MAADPSAAIDFLHSKLDLLERLAEGPTSSLTTHVDTALQDTAQIAVAWKRSSIQRDCFRNGHISTTELTSLLAVWPSRGIFSENMPHDEQ